MWFRAKIQVRYWRLCWRHSNPHFGGALESERSGGGSNNEEDQGSALAGLCSMRASHGCRGCAAPGRPVCRVRSCGFNLLHGLHKRRRHRDLVGKRRGACANDVPHDVSQRDCLYRSRHRRNGCDWPCGHRRWPCARAQQPPPHRLIRGALTEDTADVVGNHQRGRASPRMDTVWI